MPTFKNQEIAHKNQGFWLLLKFLKVWQPHILTPLGQQLASTKQWLPPFHGTRNLKFAGLHYWACIVVFLTSSIVGYLHYQPGPSSLFFFFWGSCIKLSKKKNTFGTVKKTNFIPTKMEMECIFLKVRHFMSRRFGGLLNSDGHIKEHPIWGIFP